MIIYHNIKENKYINKKVYLYDNIRKNTAKKNR